MDPKSKKVLASQGSAVTQGLKWIGGALFGDADEVLDDMADSVEDDDRGRRRRVRASAPPRAARRRRLPPPPPPPPNVIDVECFVEDDDVEDEDDE